MFAGRYFHSIDSKNRLMIPARYRDVLAEEKVRGLYATVDVFEGDRYLALYPTKGWEELLKRNEELARRDPDIALYVRKLLWDAEQLVPDKQGRLMMPERLMESAGLGNRVVLVGQGGHLEVWDEMRWKAFDAKAAGQLPKLQAKIYGQPDLAVRVQKP